MKGEKKEFKSDRNIMTGMSSPKRDQREGKIHHLSQMSKKQKKKLLERFFFISFLSSLFFVTGFCFLYSEDFFFRFVLYLVLSLMMQSKNDSLFRLFKNVESQNKS